VEQADSANAARRALSSAAYDVVVSDIGMPGEDGTALLRWLRAEELATGKRTPALALSACAREEDRRRALVAGFDAHLAKPIDPGELVTIVRRVRGR
jgi:DNA-binding response OmpR family regulator